MNTIGSRSSKRLSKKEAKKQKLLKDLDEYMLKRLGVGQADRENILKFLDKEL